MEVTPSDPRKRQSLNKYCPWENQISNVLKIKGLSILSFKNLYLCYEYVTQELSYKVCLQLKNKTY